jgi:hypothetical protein
MDAQSLLSRVTHAAIVVLVVAVACNVGWHFIAPLVPVLMVLVVFGWLFGRLLRRH